MSPLIDAFIKRCRRRARRREEGEWTRGHCGRGRTRSSLRGRSNDAKAAQRWVWMGGNLWSYWLWRASRCYYLLEKLLQVLQNIFKDSTTVSPNNEKTGEQCSPEYSLPTSSVAVASFAFVRTITEEPFDGSTPPRLLQDLPCPCAACQQEVLPNTNTQTHTRGLGVFSWSPSDKGSHTSTRFVPESCFKEPRVCACALCVWVCSGSSGSSGRQEDWGG